MSKRTISEVLPEQTEGNINRQRLIDPIEEKGAGVHFYISDLHKAIRGGDLNNFINSMGRTNLSELDGLGRTALHIAIEEKNLDIIGLLLNQDNIYDLGGFNSKIKIPVLHFAIAEGLTGVAEAIIKKYATQTMPKGTINLLNMKDFEGRTPLDIAKLGTNPYIEQILKETIKECEDTQEKNINSKATVDLKKTQPPSNIYIPDIHRAIQNGDMAALNNNGQKNLEDAFGRTPLFLSLELGKLKMTKVLLDSDVSLNNESKLTSLHLAIDEGLIGVVKEMMQHIHINLDTPLAPEMRALPNFFSDKGEDTPLTPEMRVAHDFFSDKGEDTLPTPEMIPLQNIFYTRDKWKDTPLNVAVRANNPEIVRILLQNMKMDHEDKYNDASPLQIAAENGYMEIARMLLKNGANINKIPNEVDWFLNYALFRAIEEQKYAMIEMLLRNGATLNPFREDFSSSYYEGLGAPIKIIIHTNDLESLKILINYDIITPTDNSSLLDLIDDRKEVCHRKTEGDRWEDIIKTLLENAILMHDTFNDYITDDDDGTLDESVECIIRGLKDHIQASYWFSESQKEPPIYNVFSPEEGEIICKIAANDFARKNCSLDDIKNFFKTHQLTSDNTSDLFRYSEYQTKIIENLSNNENYVYKQADKIAQYLSLGDTYPYNQDLSWLGDSSKMLMVKIISEILKENGIDDYESLIERASKLHIGDDLENMVTAMINEEVTNATLPGKTLQELESAKYILTRAVIKDTFPSYSPTSWENVKNEDLLPIGDNDTQDDI
ncbi:MAG: ankyrin repeat domain-containing protein [Rickettsiaceae bacterium]|nr:ankyrin repeat domain-containing protein [Rickettsiaceae bacterium]